MVMLPVPVPHTILLGVKATLVTPVELDKVAETVNVHPKLLVSVITCVPAPRPVTVWPVTVPELLAKEVIVCPPLEVLLIWIIPLLLPQVGLVKVRVAEGFGLTTTPIVEVLVQPPEFTLCVTT